MTFYLVRADGIGSTSAPKGAAKKAFDADALTLRVFNVGAGEALLLSRRGRGVLFDGGAGHGNNAPLGRALVAYLRSTGIKLSAFVATHPHVDHLNALATILSGDKPPSLATNAVLYHNGEVMPKTLNETLGVRMRVLAKKKRLRIVEVQSSVTCADLDGVEMHHFVDGRSEPRPAYKSIFTLVWFGAASFLFTGDAYTKHYEEKLVNGQIGAMLGAHVLKITHHGSSDGTGAILVKAVRPRIAVASTADDEGHQLEEDVKKRLRVMKGIRILDTFAVDGDIIVRTDGVERTAGGKKGVRYEIRTEKPGWVMSQS